MPLCSEPGIYRGVFPIAVPLGSNEVAIDAVRVIPVPSTVNNWARKLATGAIVVIHNAKQKEVDVILSGDRRIRGTLKCYS
jgi:hypothetical protein